MSGRRFVPALCGGLIALFGCSPASDQATCPPPDHTIASLKSTLLHLAETRSAGMEGLVWRVLTPAQCPTLPADQDRQEVLSELVRFTSESGNAHLTRRVMSGIRVALRSDESQTLELPLSALAFVVEQGADPQSRGEALYTLLDFPDDSRARQYLLKWGRSECGPPDWPDLPRDIIWRVYAEKESERSAALRRELEAEPALVQNPVARQIVEQGGVTYHPEASVNPKPALPNPCVGDSTVTPA